MRRKILLCATLVMVTMMAARGLTIKTRKGATEREQYAAEYLQKKLTDQNLKGYTIILTLATKTDSLRAEGYRIMNSKGNRITIEGNNPSGVIYGAVELA